ncbi:MAG: methyltransferase domain-containing protein [Nostoc sp.]
MRNNWQKIWNNRQISSADKPILEQLIAIDGFSSPFGQLSETEAWMEYLERIVTKLKIELQDSIFEVGCGSGAFLYPFYQKRHKVAGIDYAENLVKIALSAMPKADIKVCEAIDIHEQEQFDLVIANGVFLYFYDYDYAAKVIKIMIKLARKSIGILDIPNLYKKEEDMNRRRETIGEEEYNKQYQFLEHLYYDKNYFYQLLVNEPVNIKIENQYIANYGNNAYRFNVFIFKK